MSERKKKVILISFVFINNIFVGLFKSLLSNSQAFILLLYKILDDIFRNQYNHVPTISTFC